MNLVRFDPFRELEAMTTRLNRLFGAPPSAPDEPEGFGQWAPPMDVEEADTEYVVKTDLPDVKKDDVAIGIEDGMLTIEGERKREKSEKTKKFHRVERVYGKFVRRMTLPTNVDAGNASAEFTNGVLKVHLPKTAASTPRSVQVKVA